jgi:hypothetical protein
VFTLKGPNFHGTMLLTFCVSWVAMLALAGTLYHVELAGKRLDAQLRELRDLVAGDGRSAPSAVPAPPRLERVVR